MERRSRPLVSVVIPTYNQARYLETSIESVLAQTYPAVELIVVDDGSTDATPSILSRYGDAIRAIRQENRGAASALNRGIREARGDFICWLSSDDVLLPGKTAAQVDAFLAEPGIGMCFTGFTIIDPEGRFVADASDLPWVDRDVFVSVYWRNPINGSTVMMPRWVFDEVGLFDETLRADVDADMWLRVTDRYEVRHISGVHLQYRVHDQSLSSDRVLMTRTKTVVRLRALRDGSLLRHLRARLDADAAHDLAMMSQEFSRKNLRTLARALLRASAREGRAWSSQGEAAGAVVRGTARAWWMAGSRPVRRWRSKLARRARRSAGRV